MGSTEFEVGDQAKSLKRIFASGTATSDVTVTVKSKQITVYMLAPNGFAFADYQPYLEQLAKDELRLKERTNFNTAVNVSMGIDDDHFSRQPKTNVWFDFRNDVLWTLSDQNRRRTIAALQTVKNKWRDNQLVSN